MKKITILLPLIFILCMPLAACNEAATSDSQPPDNTPDGAFNATEYGVSTENAGTENSKNLQALIDSLTESGGTVYIPSGEYAFGENGRQTIGSHCIKMKSNVHVIGAGQDTVLKPEGASTYGLDMFYFNDYLDTGDANYLENCRFADFTIDASATSCAVYTSAGKGFMFNLFQNCHWENVTVKNTDATGFGVDCPLESSITDCTAIHCGKAATEQNGGASGFGIGFGYAERENIRITNCQSFDNKKFGFFFEHQGRFNSDKYGATATHDFVITNCTASGNLYNFGGIRAMNTVYKNCLSEKARLHGFYFENSTHSKAEACQSKKETDGAFVIAQSEAHFVNNISYERCHSESSPYGAKIISDGTATMSDNSIINCTFTSIGTYSVYTSGNMKSLTLTGNQASAATLFDASVELFENTDNSWN